MGHAHPIAHPQQIVRQIRLQIDTHGSISRLIRRPLIEKTPDIAERRAIGDDRTQSLGQQRSVPSGWLKRRPAEILLMEGTVAIEQKPFDAAESIAAP